jgi:hypothetical protein
LLTIPVAPMITVMTSMSCPTSSEFLYLHFLV